MLLSRECSILCVFAFCFWSKVFAVQYSIENYMEANEENLIVNNMETNEANLTQITFNWSVSASSNANSGYNLPVNSQGFSYENYENIKWQLQLGCYWQHINLKLLSCRDISEILALYEIECYNNQGLHIKKCRSRVPVRIISGQSKHACCNVSTLNSCFTNNSSLSFHCKIVMLLECTSAILPNTFSVLIDGGDISIHAKSQEIYYKQVTCSEYKKIYLPWFAIPQCDLGSDLSSLLDDHSKSDVILCAGEQEFPAHKIILTARSKVFASMFKSNMKEQTTGIIVIDDMNPEVLHQMLKFIYTGKIESSVKVALDLLAAAEKYDIQCLKSLCTLKLYNNIDNTNCLKILQYAVLYNENILKQKALRFIAKFYKSSAMGKNMH